MMQQRKRLLPKKTSIQRAAGQGAVHVEIEIVIIEGNPVRSSSYDLAIIPPGHESAFKQRAISMANDVNVVDFIERVRLR